MKVFEGENTTQVWNLSYEYLFENRNEQNSRIGNTHEIMKSCYAIDNPRDRWTVSRQPMISPAFAIAEIFWILAGRDESDFINTWNPSLKKYAGDVENYYGAYGQRLRVNLGFDQIKQAYETLKNNPESRQVVMQIWDGEKDLPKNEGLPNSDDIPCNLVSILKIRDQKLEWSQIMRGNDLFRGTPYNFIQFTMLQEIMAGWLELELGEYFYFTDSLHLYEKDIQIFSKRSENLPVQNPDQLLFSKKDFDNFFPKCLQLLDQVQKFGVSEENVNYLKTTQEIPQEYKNLLALPLAYLALKNDQSTLLSVIEKICTNDLLMTVWTYWKNERYKKN
jgi:thymidylate synthase